MTTFLFTYTIKEKALKRVYEFPQNIHVTQLIPTNTNKSPAGTLLYTYYRELGATGTPIVFHELRRIIFDLIYCNIDTQI